MLGTVICIAESGDVTPTIMRAFTIFAIQRPLTTLPYGCTKT